MVVSRTCHTSDYEVQASRQLVMSEIPLSQSPSFSAKSQSMLSNYLKVEVVAAIRVGEDRF